MIHDMMVLCIGRNIFTVKIFFAAIPGHRVEVVHEVCHVLGEVLCLAAVGPAQRGGQCWVSGDI